MARVSKDGQQARCSFPPFETAAAWPPQGEVVWPQPFDAAYPARSSSKPVLLNM